MNTAYFSSSALLSQGGMGVGVQVLHLGRDLSSAAGDRAPIALWFMWDTSC